MPKYSVSLPYSISIDVVVEGQSPEDAEQAAAEFISNLGSNVFDYISADNTTIDEQNANAHVEIIP